MTTYYKKPCFFEAKVLNCSEADQCFYRPGQEWQHCMFGRPNQHYPEHKAEYDKIIEPPELVTLKPCPTLDLAPTIRPLRDEVALIRFKRCIPVDKDFKDWDGIARHCYGVADAFMKAREEKP